MVSFREKTLKILKIKMIFRKRLRPRSVRLPGEVAKRSVDEEGRRFDSAQCLE